MTPGGVGIPDGPLQDGHGRLIRDLRVSVTDRCNFRCHYCMPAEGMPWIDRADILSFDEIERIVRVLADLGVEDVRLTGGEPLLRRDLPMLVERLAGIEGIRDLSLTTPASTVSTSRSTRSPARASSRSPAEMP
jgi:cyclic pyranopterin phosphate synthase